MINLKEYALGECIECVIDHRGITPTKMGGEWTDSGVRVISALNVHEGNIDNEDQIRCVSDEIYKKWMPDDIKKNDCLIVSEGYPGESLLWDSDEKIVLGQRLYAVRVNPEILDPWYFAGYMQTNKFRKQINQISTGSTVFGISQKELLKIKLLLPDISKQRKIGTVYKLLKKCIENNNAFNAELESIAQTIYDYWFLQFEFPNEEGEPYKSSGGKMVWNEELKREIPEGWEVDSLQNHIRLEKGISYTSDDIRSAKGVPMINLASIDTNRNYKANELKYFSGEYNSNKVVKCKDMLIACTDLTRNAYIVGSPILVPDAETKYLYSTDLAKLELTDSVFNPLFIYMMLRTDYYHNYIKGFASGTNVMHLNTDGIKWFRTYIPTKSLQDKFASIIDVVYAEGCKIMRENQQLTSLRDFLLPLLMNGQVSFKDD